MTLVGIFIIGELCQKGSFFIWLGFGAATSGILALLDIEIAGQIAVFINISGILILLERRFSERYIFKKPLSRTTSRDAEADANVFRKVGAGWEIRYAGKSYSIKNSKGLVHIRNLISQKGEWIHCSVLKGLSADAMHNTNYDPYKTMTPQQLNTENLRIQDGFSSEDIIDRFSLADIKKMRAGLVERKAVDDFNSPEEKIDQLNTLEFIEQYLKKALDHKGRPRKLNNQTDTDRKAVSVAINRSRNNLRENKELYTHFKSFIKAEGNAFRYLPDRSIDWKTE